jgi:hypothetical protein
MLTDENQNALSLTEPTPVKLSHFTGQAECAEKDPGEIDTNCISQGRRDNSCPDKEKPFIRTNSMHLTCKRYKLIRLITPLMCFSPPPLRARTIPHRAGEWTRDNPWLISLPREMNSICYFTGVLSAVKKLLFLQGWAQVNGRDDLPIPVKVEYDEYYLNHRSFLFDLKTRLP